MSAPAHLRSQILAEIESIAPLDALEALHRADAIAWVMSGDELCRLAKPATPPKHLVAYFVVLDGPKMLLVDHKNAQLWLPSGGHIEASEHPRGTVGRELFEELGLKASHAIGPPLMITASQTVGLTSGHVDVSLWYVVHFDRGQTIKYDAEEFNSVRWFDLAELPYERSDPHLRRFVEKLKSGPPVCFS